MNVDGILLKSLSVHIYIHTMSVLPLPPIHKGKKFVVLSDWVSFGLQEEVQLMVRMEQLPIKTVMIT
jgi:hypothetical protein